MSTPEINLNFKECYKYYPYDCSYLDGLATDITLSLQAYGNAWTKAEPAEIKQLLVVALKIYFFNTHYRTLLLCSRVVPSKMALDYLTTCLRVPRFVRDVVREYCRPMFSNHTIYLPDIEYEKVNDDKPFTEIFGSVDVFPKWNYMMERVGYDMVELVAEFPRACPLSFAVEWKMETYSIAPLEEWRLEAFSRLRHLRSVPEGGEPTTIRGIDAKEPYEEIIHSDRYAGPIPCFTYSFACVPRRYGLIHREFRFPTIDDRSFTPPQASYQEAVTNKARKTKMKRPKGPSLLDESIIVKRKE